VISQENGPRRADRPAWYRSLAFYVGVLSLAMSVCTWVKLPHALGYCFSAQHSPAQGDLGWLLNLGLAWPIWVGLEAIVMVGWAVGTALIGAGLLRRGKRALLLPAGLIAIAPATAIDILLIPGRVAVVLGRAYRGVDPSDPLVRHTLALMGSGLLIASVIGVVYFWWVWRTYRRLSAETAE
jgi:hypothetical protein